ncbi:MAG: lipopolysaccharide biosynthesis protein [Salinigranum sp.]
MKETPELSLGRETLIGVGSKAVNGVLGFAGVIVFANVLGDVGLGKYRTVLAAAFVVTQVSAGTSTAIQKRVSEVDVSPAEFLGAGLAFHLVFSILVGVGFLVVEPFVSPYFGTYELAGGVVLVVFALGLFNVVNRFYAGIGYPALSSWVDTARSLLTLLFQLLFLFFGLQAFGLVLGFVVGTVGSALVSYAVAGVTPARPTHRVFRRIYDFARWSVPGSLLTNLYSSADVLIVRVFAGASGVGFYSVAIQMSQPSSMFGSAITNAFTIKSSGLDSVGKSVRADLKNVMSYAGLIAVPMTFGALAIPNALFTTLFGPSFADAPGLALVGLMVFQMFSTYCSPLSAAAAATDRPDINFRMNVAVVAVHLPLAALLGYYYGLLGVIASTVAVEIGRFTVYQYIAHRHFGGVVFTRPMGEQVFSGAVMFALVWAIEHYVVTITSWVWLVVVVGVGAAAYFLVLGVVSRHFRATVGNVLPWLPAPLDPGV